MLALCARSTGAPLEGPHTLDRPGAHPFGEHVFPAVREFTHG